MEKATKLQLAEDLKGEIADVPGLVLLGFDKLTVADADDLRNKFREAGCTYRVYKNSTVKFAVAGTSHEPVQEILAGATGLAYNADDPGAPARVARDFAKDHDSISLKGGVMEGEVLDTAGLLKLADMPGPRELKAKLLMLFNTPATRMVQVLHAPLRDFLNVLNAKKDKDEG